MIFFVFLQNHSFVFRFCFTDGGRNAAFFVERKEVTFFFVTCCKLQNFTYLCNVFIIKFALVVQPPAACYPSITAALFFVLKKVVYLQRCTFYSLFDLFSAAGSPKQSLRHFFYGLCRKVPIYSQIFRQK